MYYVDIVLQYIVTIFSDIVEVHHCIYFGRAGSYFETFLIENISYSVGLGNKLHFE